MFEWKTSILTNRLTNKKFQNALIDLCATICCKTVKNTSIIVWGFSAIWVGQPWSWFWNKLPKGKRINAKGAHDYSLSWNCYNVLACCFCSWKFVTVKNRSPIVGILQFWAELVLKRHAICEAIYFLKEGHITILNTFYDLTIQCPSLFSAYKV